MEHDDIQFHNVGALSGPEQIIQRVPDAVRRELNDGAQDRMRHPAGVELRFVPESSVELVLSTVPDGPAETSLVRVFWGPIQDTETYRIGPDPTTITLSPPATLDALDAEAIEPLEYHPRVCRVVLPGEHRGGYVRYHRATGNRRPPTEAELPSVRYLAYGTSITEGEAPVAEHLTYVNQTARRLGADPINLGSCGTAYCDPAMADHIAQRTDWDVATLSISVNMIGTFSVDTFGKRAETMIDRIAGSDPNRPVAAITVFPNARDVCTGHSQAQLCEQFRETLRSVVTDCDHENVTLIEGPELLGDIGGLTTDLVHPGDNAMIRIGTSLADRLAPLLDAD